jgi:hypothetical protein
MIVNRPQQRRLLDKVRVTFHVTCDEGQVEIAEILLGQMKQIIDEPLRLPAGFNRRRPERLTGPAERLMNLLLWRMPTVAAEPSTADRPRVCPVLSYDA